MHPGAADTPSPSNISSVIGDRLVAMQFLFVEEAGDVLVTEVQVDVDSAIGSTVVEGGSACSVE